MEGRRRFGLGVLKSIRENLEYGDIFFLAGFTCAENNYHDSQSSERELSNGGSDWSGRFVGCRAGRAQGGFQGHADAAGGQVARPRRRPPDSAGRHPRHVQHAGEGRHARPPTPSSFSTATTCRTGAGDRESPPAWKIDDGALVIAPGAGEILSKDEFGDCQLHLEFAAPVPPRGRDQGRGNSGVMFFGRYEIQVLDSYQNRHLRRRPGGGDLRPVSAARQRLAPARPVADLRHHFQGATLSSGSLAGVTGLRHHAPQRRARSRPPAGDRRDGLSGGRQIHAARTQGPDPACKTTATRSGSAISGFET